MYISQELRKKNVCEYLLYMWQVEDTLRAFGLDVERIEAEYVSRFDYSEEQRREVGEWYANLARMMREEGVAEKGHVQVVKNTMQLLNELHIETLKDPKQPFYSATYYKALPYIVELRAKGGGEKPEVETCLDALYGVMMLRLQGHEMSQETKVALEAITQLVALLAKLYQEQKDF